MNQTKTNATDSRLFGYSDANVVTSYTMLSMHTVIISDAYLSHLEINLSLTKNHRSTRE